MTKQEQSSTAAKIANIALGTGGIASAFVSFYSFYHYGWTGEKQFTSWMGAVWYCALPAFLAGLLLASLRLKPAYKLSLAVLCLVIVTSTYAAELFVLQPQQVAWVGAPADKTDEVVHLAKQYGVDFDVRDEGEVIADLRQHGVDAVPAVLPAEALLKIQGDGSMKSAINVHGAEVIPLSGISHKLTVLCNQGGQYVTYKSDAYGFHNPEGIWKSGPLDVAALGKSFTHGFCVPSDKNFVALIRNRYPGTLNLGIATHGPLFMLASLKEYLPPLAPRVVLWFYAEGNHVMYLQQEKKSPLLMNYLKDDFDQGLRWRQSDINHALMDYVEKDHAQQPRKQPGNRDTRLAPFLNAIKLPTLRQKVGLVYGTDSRELEEAAEWETNLKLFRDILSHAKRRVSAWNGKLHFVYLPSWERYKNNDSRIADEERAAVLNLAASLDIPSIDLHPAFLAQSDPLSLFPFRRFYHYNEQGHRLVAEEVLKVISRVPQEPHNNSAASLRY